MGRGELHGKEEGEEELGFAGGRFTRDFGDVAGGNAAPEGEVQVGVEGADCDPLGGEGVSRVL